MSDDAIGQESKKPSRFVISIVMFLLIVAAAFAAPTYVKQIPPLAIYALAIFACWICSPWIRRNLGNVGMPIAGAAMLYFAFVPNASSITESLPSPEDIRASLPKLEWPQGQESDEESGTADSKPSESSTTDTPAGGETTATEGAETTTPADTSPTVLGYIKPSRPAVSIRPAVDSAIAADKAELAVIQHTDKWGSWLSYSIWVRKKFNLDPQESEWRGLRNGLKQTPLNVDDVKASRDAMLALGDVSLNAEGQAVGSNNKATLWINNIYQQYLAEVKNK